MAVALPWTCFSSGLQDAFFWAKYSRHGPLPGSLTPAKPGCQQVWHPLTFPLQRMQPYGPWAAGLGHPLVFGVVFTTSFGLAAPLVLAAA